MKILARLLVTSTLALSAAVGTASAPAAAVTVAATATQDSPWRIDTYVRNGQPVGSIEYYCGWEIIYGDLSNPDYIHYAYLGMCP